MKWLLQSLFILSFSIRLCCEQASCACFDIIGPSWDSILQCIELQSNLSVWGLFISVCVMSTSLSRFSEGWLPSWGSWIHPCHCAPVAVVCVTCCECEFYPVAFKANCIVNAKCPALSGVQRCAYQSGVRTQCLHIEDSLSQVSRVIPGQIYSLLISKTMKKHSINV